MTLASAILAALLVLSPPARPRETLPGWLETPDARATRYASIAHDLADAIADACGDRPLCQRRAAALLLGVAYHESDFAPDVDAGRCYRGASGLNTRCDSGRAVSIFQLQGSTEERALWIDRRQAARAALRRIYRSQSACRHNDPSEVLAAYAGGRCENPAARRRAHELAALITRAASALPPFAVAAQPIADVH